MGDALRPEDTVVRLGGDEFLIVCEGIQGEASALQMVRRPQSLLGEEIEQNGVVLHPSMSVGIALKDDPRLSPQNWCAVPMWRWTASSASASLANWSKTPPWLQPTDRTTSCSEGARGRNSLSLGLQTRPLASSPGVASTMSWPSCSRS